MGKVQVVRKPIKQEPKPKPKPTPVPGQVDYNAKQGVKDRNAATRKLLDELGD